MSNISFLPVNFNAIPSFTSKPEPASSIFASVSNENCGENQELAKSHKIQYLEMIFGALLVGNELIPSRMKILVDQIVEYFNLEDVIRVLSKSGWSLDDLQRGYLVSDSPTFKCVGIKSELTLFHVIGSLFPDLASTADKLRNSLLESLMGNTGNVCNNSQQLLPVASTSAVLDHLETTGATQEGPSSSRTSSTFPPAFSPLEVSERSEKSRIFKSTKRRVQCHTCGRSFCDKGALKIHNSAVHLKETHTCTVEGCGRVFSSRRSRNRHSGNPNLHTALTMKRSGSSSVEQTLKCTVPAFMPTANPNVMSLFSRLTSPMDDIHRESPNKSNSSTSSSVCDDSITSNTQLNVDEMSKQLEKVRQFLTLNTSVLIN
ncbi:unnamed protein product [Bursaphelenchus okinawaensis]|uniref:C2H2-type domain-containing protein n=1 Tax=Bursaphelenchus okinawaensis TaxID=465554 RepID=A0A811LF81_9BILA|nr:unnamed protein product [Bursaphelenchus okinawaensis]CAG9121190.1 unnamed protein product [Bursaphelenchus okinawaensis]